MLWANHSKVSDIYSSYRLVTLALDLVSFGADDLIIRHHQNKSITLDLKQAVGKSGKRIQLGFLSFCAGTFPILWILLLEVLVLSHFVFMNRFMFYKRSVVMRSRAFFFGLTTPVCTSQ